MERAESIGESGEVLTGAAVDHIQILERGEP
jgi:hypothetical protein